MFLESIGADARVFGAFQVHPGGAVLARIASAQCDRYRIFTESAELDAEPSGALWYRAETPAAMPVTGDWVAARAVGPGQAIVEAVLPRRTCFSRRAAGTREQEQPLAANIDLVFLVCGLDGDFNPRRIERYLAVAAASGASAVIVLNKADLCADLPARVRETRAIAGATPVVTASALGSDLAGIAPFLQPGRTVALVGSSGAGKSTIVNRLLGEERLRTGAVRDNDSRGRHTTTHRELIPLPGRGALIDTPGLREIQLWADAGAVDQAFEDVAELAAGCRFRDCSHSGESGCAVVDALPPERLDSYRKLLAEARRHESLADPLAALERKRRDKRLHRAIRRYNQSRE